MKTNQQFAEELEKRFETITEKIRYRPQMLDLEEKGQIVEHLQIIEEVLEVTDK